MRRTFLLATTMLLAMVCSATAQERATFDMSFGPSQLHDQTLDDWFPGFHIAAAGNITSVFGIAGSFSWHFKDVETGIIDVRLTEYAYLVGPRVSAPRPATVAPFAQLLVGGAHISASTLSVFLGEGPSITKFAVQPEGGVDIWFGRHVGVRGTLFYRRVYLEPEGVNQYGYTVGVVLGNGGR